MSFLNCFYYSGILKAQQLTTWTNMSLHFPLLKSFMYQAYVFTSLQLFEFSYLLWRLKIFLVNDFFRTRLKVKVIISLELG